MKKKTKVTKVTIPAYRYKGLKDQIIWHEQAAKDAAIRFDKEQSKAMKYEHAYANLIGTIFFIMKDLKDPLVALKIFNLLMDRYSMIISMDPRFRDEELVTFVHKVFEQGIKHFNDSGESVLI